MDKSREVGSADDSLVSEEELVLCPSSRCKKGHILLGIVQANGKIGFLDKQLLVNQEFVETAYRGRKPEKRFRFASPCAKVACKQWNSGRCGVLDNVFNCVPQEHRITEIPQCSIRNQCRWYQQNGYEACTVCPLIITDLMV